MSIFKAMRVFINYASSILLFAACFYFAYLISPTYERRGHPCMVGVSFGYIVAEDQDNWLQNPRRQVTVRYIDKNFEWHLDSFPVEMVKDMTIIDVDEFLKKEGK